MLSKGGLLSHVSLIVSDYHDQITGALADAAKDELITANPAMTIDSIHVSGTFEVLCATSCMLEHAQAAIAIGCIIKGETDHHQFLAQTCIQVLGQLSAETKKPVGLAILTVNDLEQAIARAGGHHGNKGREAAAAVCQLWQALYPFQKQEPLV